MTLLPKLIALLGITLSYSTLTACASGYKYAPAQQKDAEQVQRDCKDAPEYCDGLRILTSGLTGCAPEALTITELVESAYGYDGWLAACENTQNFSRFRCVRSRTGNAALGGLGNCTRLLNSTPE